VNYGMEKTSKELGEILEAAISPFKTQKKIMFGAPVYVINGNMFAGVHGNNIFLRLSEADKTKISSEYSGAAPFEPVKGHIMKEYMTLHEELYSDREAFGKWIERALKNAEALKPKEPKARGKKS
jgi:TfoX/Sxy family transcriptional regulator of competence genes